MYTCIIYIYIYTHIYYTQIYIYAYIYIDNPLESKPLKILHV